MLVSSRLGGRVEAGLVGGVGEAAVAAVGVGAVVAVAAALYDALVVAGGMLLLPLGNLPVPAALAAAVAVGGVWAGGWPGDSLAVAAVVAAARSASGRSGTAQTRITRWVVGGLPRSKE